MGMQSMARWGTLRDPLEDDTNALEFWLGENVDKTDKFDPEVIATELAWEKEVRDEFVPDVKRVLVAMTEYIRRDNIKKDKIAKSWRRKLGIRTFGKAYGRWWDSMNNRWQKHAHKKWFKILFP